MGKQPKRIGIIGAGWAGEQHICALLSMPDRAEIPILAEVNPRIAAAVAARWKIPVWTADYQEVFNRSDLDAVSICLPHRLHAKVAIAAAQAGLHVLVEKPLASTLAEADAMIQVATHSGVTLMVAENVRFDPVIRRAAKIIHSGALGNLFLIRIAREHNMRTYLNQRPWFLSDADAGILASGGVHDFELLRMLAGEIKHVYALQGPKVFDEMEADDNSVVLAGMACGTAAVIVETFCLRTPHSGVFCSVHGSLGSMWLPGKDADSIRIYSNGEDDRIELMDEEKVPPEDTFILEMSHFLDCLKDPGLEPISSGVEERKPLAAVLAAYESIRTGKRIDLKSFDTSAP